MIVLLSQKWIPIYTLVRFLSLKIAICPHYLLVPSNIGMLVNCRIPDDLICFLIANKYSLHISDTTRNHKISQSHLINRFVDMLLQVKDTMFSDYKILQ